MERLRTPFPDFKLGEIIDPDQFDVNSLYTEDKINELVDQTNVFLSAQGADAVGIVPPSPFTADSVQKFLDDLITRLTSVTIGSSGASLIGTPSVLAFPGNTVEEQLKSLSDLSAGQFVTTSRIRDRAVTSAKLATSAVKLEHLDNSLLATLPEQQLVAKVLQLEDEADVLTYRADMTEGRVNALTPRVSTLENRATSLEGRSTVSELNISQLATDVGHLNIHVDDSIAHNFPVKIIKADKDEEDIFTTVEHIRKSNDMLVRRSTLSGGTSPRYTTRTITYYDSDGQTAIKTDAFTLSYDEDGELISEV